MNNNDNDKNENNNNNGSNNNKSDKILILLIITITIVTMIIIIIIISWQSEPALAARQTGGGPRLRSSREQLRGPSGPERRRSFPSSATSLTAHKLNISI